MRQTTLSRIVTRQHQASWSELPVDREHPTARRAAFLQQVPLFAGLSKAEYAQLASALQERQYKKQQVIFHADDPGHALYILTRGLVKITIEAADWHELIVMLLYPKDFFGEMALVDGLPRSATATALQPTHVLVLEQHAFISFLEQNPRLVRSLAEILGRRIRKANELIRSLAFLDAPGKVARTVLDLVRDTGQTPARGTGPRVQLTQSMLADLAGTSRETTARVLSDLQQAGYLQVHNGMITILDPVMLAQMSHTRA